jgi:hypothetical protein
MKTFKLCLIIVLLTSLNLYSQQLQRLRVSDDHRHIVTDDNHPFLWLGGTAWELIHRLNREEIKEYMKDRSEKGFTVIQTVILAELDGLNTPDAYGDLPLIDNDPTRLNEAYFKHVDFVVEEARKNGLYLGLLPTWGDKYNKKWGIGPEIFTIENAEIYGELVARRYLHKNNIIWILGGDRLPENDTQYKIIEAMARGIRKVDTLHLITYHPWGGKRATEVFNDPWLDLDLFQSGHDRRTKDYAYVRDARKVEPARPVINGEPRYENIPDRLDGKARYGWMDDSDVRTSAYWTMLSGAAGYTYGCNDIWQMYSLGKTPVILARTGWSTAIHLPGSTHAGYMRRLLESFPWQDLRPDQSLILNENPEDTAYMVSAIGKDNDYILAYTPMGRSLTINLAAMNAGKVKAYWFNPRSGRSLFIREFTGDEKPEFKPWSVGRGSDFVLIIVRSQSGFSIPGL